jgi:hypothetical protein
MTRQSANLRAPQKPRLVTALDDLDWEVATPLRESLLAQTLNRLIGRLKSDVYGYLRPNGIIFSGPAMGSPLQQSPDPRNSLDSVHPSSTDYVNGAPQLRIIPSMLNTRLNIINDLQAFVRLLRLSTDLSTDAAVQVGLDYVVLQCKCYRSGTLHITRFGRCS